MRLIDADTLEQMGYVLTRTYQQDEKTMVYETKKLSDVPTIDAVPVVHGKWIQMNGHRYCNVCWYKDSPILTHYCPSCGAKMDRKKKMDE